MSFTSNQSNGIGKAGWTIIGSLAIVALIAGVYYYGAFPSSADSTGAIGAAKKYQAEQMTDADVKLDNPELQALLQDDKVLAILEDK